MIRVLISFLLILALHSAYAEPAGQRFVSIAFHDVVDDTKDLDLDAITTDRLIAFFEWLRGNGWSAISLDDLARARSGEKALPKKPILITFDDGYQSFYTRVYPLVLAYRIPVISALVGSWMEAPMDGSVLYNNVKVPRSHFISWEQAREMQRSGFVEFASHSYEMHREVLGNPQGNTLPAAATREFSPKEGYEKEAPFRTRVHDDLERSRKLMERELGHAPRALVWPFGRYTGSGLKIAREMGFDFAMTLQPEPASTAEPMQLSRYLPTHNPTLGEIVSALRFDDPLPSAQRLVCVNPALLWSADPKEADLRLGRAIERLRTLGATTVVIDAALIDSDGKIQATWFPNGQLPMRADLLSRLTWQMRSRAGVDVVIRLPHLAAKSTLHKTAQIETLFRDLAAQVPMDGLLVEGASFPTFNGLVTDPSKNRQARAELSLKSLSSNNSLALSAFRAAEFERPGLRLIWHAPHQTRFGAISALADLTLFDAKSGDLTKKWKLPNSRAIGLWIEEPIPPSADQLISTMRTFQRQGGTAICWSPDDPVTDLPQAAHIAPSLSASTFPVKF